MPHSRQRKLKIENSINKPKGVNKYLCTLLVYCYDIDKNKNK